jgi:uncharacterized membrane protein
MEGFLFGLTLATALASGLVAGVFFAFSTFVMKGLARLPAAQGAAAMQAINVAAITPPFMLALFGAGAASAVLAVWGVADWGEDYGAYLVAAGVLYVLGVVVLTITYHVPRNDALARVEPTRAEAASVWNRYLVEWTRANHVRTAAPLAAAGLLIAGLTV